MSRCRRATRQSDSAMTIVDSKFHLLSQVECQGLLYTYSEGKILRAIPITAQLICAFVFA